MASILSWFGNQASRIEKQVNPFDNGATYSNPNPRPAPPPQYNTGGLSVNNAPNTQRISTVPAPVRPARPLLFNNSSNKQQINVPKFTGPGTYSWSKPPAYQLPQLGAPGGGGVNLGHWFGSSLFENALNAPEQIKNIVQAKQAGLINNEQAVGGVGNALLNSAGLALPAGKTADILKIAKPALKDMVIQGAKTGAKLGAGFGATGGALGAMQQGGNAGQVVKSTLINAPIGAVSGAVLGGAVPVAAKGVKLGVDTAPKVAKAVKPQIPEALLQERNKWVVTHANAKDPAIKNFADRKITQIDNQISMAREGGFVKIPGGKNVNKPNVPEVPDFLKPSAKYSSENRAKATGTQGQKGLLAPEQLSESITKKLQHSGPVARPIRGIEGKASDASPGQPSRPRSSGNYTTNPTEVKIADVSPGDYGKARSNAQLASAPVEYAAGQVARIARNLKLSTSKLGRLVEGTDKPVNGAEREAIKRYNQFSDRIHATSQALGGNTPYRANYFHHEWDLSNPETANKFEQFRQRKFGSELDPTQFEGLDTQPRVFDTVAEGEAAGFKLKNPNAANEILDYGQRSASALKRQALTKGFMEADANELDKPHTFDLGGGKTIALSEKGNGEIRAFAKSKPVNSTTLKVYRGTNRKLKQTLLSASEFHPINITKKVAPGLALKGHPVLATKGTYGAFRAQIGRKYSDALQQSFQEKGIVDFGSRVGSPLKFGSDYASEGKLNLGHAGLGEKTIFEKSMPALHGRALQALKADLDKKNISYDSPEARAAGTRINEMMGFINTEVRNLDKGHQKFLGDVLLAPQFTRAKWATIKSALKDKGVAGSYARRAVIGDTLATATVMLGLGYLAKQKSDDVKDLLIRALVHPSVPTPFKDSKGNTIELGMPSTYASEALGLVANITRNKDGHLGINFSPSNLPGNLGNYGRSRLALLPGSGLKVATNTDFANKPLYDPNAPAGTKVQQAATTLFGGAAPIGLQGALETNAIKSHLPQGAQQVLTANTPGSNPLIKSIGASFGLTPRTDKTVGKGQQTTQYFDTLAAASKGLNRQEKDALDLYTGGKKNPVTGKYEINPTANDSRAKAVALLQSPKVIGNLITMNRSLEDKGQKVDPLWNLTQAQVTKYLQYQSMPPAGADKSDWYNKNQSWYAPLAKQRDAFFNTLPPSDPNKPKAPIQYPNPSSAVQNAINTYNGLTDSTAKGNFLDNHPEIIKQWNAVSDYNNKMRQAQGYAPLKNYPEAAPQLQNFMDAYTAADKGTRKGIRNANPQQYQNMIAYFDAIDLYNNNKQGAISALQGEPDYTSKQAKSIQSLAQDIYQNPDGTYSIVPAGWMNGLSNGSGGYGGKKSAYASAAGGQFKLDMAKKPLKIVGSLPAPSKSTVPKFAVPTLKTVYQKPSVNTKPTVGFKKSKRA